MEQLLTELCNFIPQEQRDEAAACLDSMEKLPCGQAGNFAAYLIERGWMTFEDFLKLQNSFQVRNINLNIFKMSETSFGVKWGQSHIFSLSGDFERPEKGRDHHDAVLDVLKIEIKASRAVERGNSLPLDQKALRFGEQKPFTMNFNHIFLDEADVYLFLGVWLDKICYWLLTKVDLLALPNYLNKYQTEYQMPITDANISSFERYRLEKEDLIQAIRKVRA